MNGRFERYLQEQLGTTGFVILDHALAYRLRPDIFGMAGNCANAFSESHREIDPYLRNAGVALYAAKLELAAERFFVASRSPDQLAERIGWITGRSVVELIAAESVRSPARAAGPTPQAGAEIPGWPCTDRARGLEKDGKSDAKFVLPAAGSRGW
jgi:hypothetical protein